MTTYSTETPVNGHEQDEPPFGQAPITPPASTPEDDKHARMRARRAEDRADRDANAKRKRQDREHKRQLKINTRNQAVARKLKTRADKEKIRAKRRKARKDAWSTAMVRLSHHMPLWGLPVVAVSMGVGWTGQASAAAHLGMGWAAAGVPVLTEGMTLTFAGLTGQAIEQKRPYRWLMRTTWTTAVVAAVINGSGHLIEDDSAAGVYRACAYAGASLAALILWWVVMRSKRAAISGRTAEEIARWKRLRRRHPILVRRARRIADNTGISLEAAYAKAWERANGAAPGEPSIREIRSLRRAAYRRAAAESWDGRSWFRRGDVAPAPVLPAAVEPEPETVPEPAEPDAPEVIPAPYLPVALAVPGADGQWIAHRVPVHPLGASAPLADAGSETATTRFPQGQEPLPGAGADAPENESGEQPDEAGEQVRERVADDRLEKVRALVEAAAEEGKNLRRHPSVRQTARHLGCRPGTARDYLTQVLAERGIGR
ncbi:hypothetical protein [Streptomyces sp. NPDC013489]|uniref:hypothetical protein n=1 Tax=Streptomyces sp. NPDC013489 TaxID=3155606 RepID=UPI0033D5AB2A